MTQFLVEHSLELKMEICKELVREGLEDITTMMIGADLVLFDKSDHTVNLSCVNVSQRYEGTFSTLTLTVPRLV